MVARKGKKRTPAQVAKLKRARKAEAVADKVYDRAKSTASKANRAQRKAEVNLSNKQLARIRLQ